jgi:hypothetical protein
MKRHLLFFALGSTLAIGCGDGAPEDAGLQKPEETFTRTIVVLHADGTQDVKELTVSASQQKLDVERRNAAERAQAGSGASTFSADGVGQTSQAMVRPPVPIAQDSCDDKDALWMFDRANLTGNEICFYGVGTVDLSTYLRIRGATFWLSWKGAVRSLKNGSEYSTFVTPLIDPDGGHNVEDTYQLYQIWLGGPDDPRNTFMSEVTKVTLFY